MKAIHKLLAIAASLVMLSSLSQADLVTNYFQTALGEITNAANWSLGTVPVIGTDVGVLDSIIASNTSSTALNNKQLILNGTAIIRGQEAISATNFNIVLNNTSQLYGMNNGGTLARGTLTLNDSSLLNIGANSETFTACTINLNGTSTGLVSRTTTLKTGTVVNLNDYSKFRLRTRTSTTIDYPSIELGSYFNFTSTNAVLQGYFNTVDYSANFNQMIIDGKIRANGLTVSTNNFKVTYIPGNNTVTNGTFVQLIPEPATAGLFGLAGAMVFLLRRQMKKKQNDEID